MNRLFSADNLFFRLILKLCSMLLVNVLFLICCIPVITIGPSYCALYYTTGKNLRSDRSYTLHTFFEGFRKSFRQGIAGTLLFLLVSGVLLGDVAVMKTFEELGKLQSGFDLFFWILLGFVLLYFLWVFAQIAIFENSMKKVLKNGFMLMIAELPCTIICAFILFFVGTVIWLLPALVVIMPSIGTWLIRMRMDKSFVKYMDEEQLQKEREYR